MSIITFSNGQKVNFNGNPTPSDVEFVAKQLGIKPETQVLQPKQNLLQKTGQFLLGATKEVPSLIKGTSSLGEKVIQAPLKALGMKFPEKSSAQQLQNIIESKNNITPGSITEATNPYQGAGKFAAQVAEFALPQTKLVKATESLPLATRLLSRVATSGAIASAQEGTINKNSAIAAGTELLLPGIGKVLKPVTSIVGRLFTGLGSGLSGVSSDALNKIVSNPQEAIKISQQISKNGQESVLENNAKTIINGVSKINKNASEMYKKGLESLQTTDIKPEILAKNSLSALEKNSIQVTENGFDLSNSEILNKNIQNRAKKLLTEINSINVTDGKKVSEIIRKIETSKFSSSIDPDRAAYNNLANDLHTGLKNAVNESTDKLSEINSQYSTAKNLTNGIQDIFGKVKFKNTSELNNVARKLETLFSQKGLDGKTVDEFLTTIGIKPENFRTSEAVRNIATKSNSSNGKGLSWSEILPTITSSLVTPSAVKNIAIATGLSKQAIETIVKHTAPTGRAAIIQSLINQNK